MYENTPAALAAKKQFRIAVGGVILTGIGILIALSDVMSTWPPRAFGEPSIGALIFSGAGLLMFPVLFVLSMGAMARANHKYEELTADPDDGEE